MTPSLETQQTMVLVGKLGSGKSSVANMLVQGNMHSKNKRTVSDSAASVTTQVEMVSGRQWAVYDTVGLGEKNGQGQSAIDPAVKLLTKVLKESKRGFHYFAFVVDKGPLATAENVELFELFKATFAGAEKNFVLVITHCSKPDWAKKNRAEIVRVFGNLPVVTCDFPFDPSDVIDGELVREDSLASLEKQLRALPREPCVPELSLPTPAYSTNEQVLVRNETKHQFLRALAEFLKVAVAVLASVSGFTAM